MLGPTKQTTRSALARLNATAAAGEQKRNTETTSLIGSCNFVFILKVFVIAKRVVGPILERVYCCHRAKLVSASGVHKTQPKVPTPLVWCLNTIGIVHQTVPPMWCNFSAIPTAHP